MFFNTFCRNASQPWGGGGVQLHRVGDGVEDCREMVWLALCVAGVIVLLAVLPLELGDGERGRVGRGNEARLGQNI